MFDTGLVPTVWRKAIICPILKDPDSDKRLPLNYMGISLLSCVSNLYTSFLNKRLSKYLEGKHILADEQNGFRANRSCENHVFTLSSIIHNNDNVFTTFIDLRWCFDVIDRKILLYKLLLNHVNDTFYNYIRNIYASATSCILLNKSLREWFNCSFGVKQCCTVSPTLFATW